jgi:hypothetical protein
MKAVYDEVRKEREVLYVKKQLAKGKNLICCCLLLCYLTTLFDLHKLNSLRAVA